MIGFFRPSAVFATDIITSPVEVDGIVHHFGEKRVVDISSREFCTNNMPNPDDYTLENLIKSGADLHEVSSPLLGSQPIDLGDATEASINYLQDDKNFSNN